MSDVRLAKLFKNGASQAVRLPAEFRFEGDEVYVMRDERTGDVVLSRHPGEKTWEAFYDFLETVEVPDRFLAERPMNAVPPERHVFSSDE